MTAHTLGTAPSRPRSIGMLSLIVIGLGLATAIIHMSLVPDEFAKGATGYGTLFILTAVGYLAALVVMYAPLDSLDPYRGPARLLLIAIAGAAIAAYVYLGYFDTLGWVTKAIEGVLVIAALTEMATPRRS